MAEKTLTTEVFWYKIGILTALYQLLYLFAAATPVLITAAAFATTVRQTVTSLQLELTWLVLTPAQRADAINAITIPWLITLLTAFALFAFLTVIIPENVIRKLAVNTYIRRAKLRERRQTQTKQEVFEYIELLKSKGFIFEKQDDIKH